MLDGVECILLQFQIWARRWKALGAIRVCQLSESVVVGQIVVLLEMRNYLVGVAQLVLELLVVAATLKGVAGPNVGSHAFVELVCPA